MRIFDKWKKKEENEAGPVVYNEEEGQKLEEYITDTFGNFDEVIHEIVSPDIHIDIAIIEPNEKCDYYKLVTMGMGARPMSVPEEWKEYQLEHAELVVYLPKDWDVHSDDENSYWPIRWLKMLARMPIEHDTWLGYGHTIAAGANHEKLSDNNQFEGVALVEAKNNEQEAAIFVHKEKAIRFYQMFPLYGTEMDYKLKSEDIDKLLELFDEKDLSFVVDIDRENYIQEVVN